MEKSYQPKSFEKRIYDFWLEKKYFSAEVDSRPHFSVVMPPPNVTGKAHVGHALNNTVQDILVRTKRMQGFNTLWIPGTDHAAIATEEVLVRKLKSEGKSKDSVGREEFLNLGWQWYREYGSTICDQLKSLGISCDWDRLAFTMDETLNQAVRHVFCKYFDEGLIYRGTRVVNYCPHCHTTISDNENVHIDQTTFLWYIRYPFADGSGDVVVATTRPETIFGDTAVAVNPNDPKFKNKIGKELILPLVDRKIKLIADEYCEMGFGTGAVKITPAHDPNDYNIGLRHNLDVIVCIDENGKLTKEAGQFEGLDRIDARPIIEKALKEGGFLIKKEKYKNQVGTCDRCHNFTEPKISTQWFVKMDELVKPAIEAVKSGEIKFHPKRYEKTYLNWLENSQDWCISRQIWLGHRIPVFYCGNCGNIFASEETPSFCPKCKHNHLEQDKDVLDTWFSSALWPFSTLGYPQKTKELEKYYPTSVLVTAYDIITFWVSKMVFSGIKLMGKIPFKDVLINGIVRDSQGRKMSKHLGNGIDPIEMVEKYGADALRLSLINGTSTGSDIPYGEERALDAKIFINKLYNAGKFVLLNIQGKKDENLEKIKLKEVDKWILSALDETIKTVTKNIDKYSLSIALGNLIDFTVSKFCDWYIEAVKVDLYGQDLKRKNDVQNILAFIYENILKLFHPFIPFVTEYIYQQLPNSDESIMIQPFPNKLKIKGLKNNFEEIIELIRFIRNARATLSVPDNKRTDIYLIKNNHSNLDESLPIISKLANGLQISIRTSEPEEKCVKVISSVANAYLPVGQLFDGEKEKERINKEIESVKFEIQRSEKLLSNDGFVKKAPALLIEKEKAKLEKNRIILEKLNSDLKGI